MNDSVLITDGHWRKTLAAVRGLGRKGVPVAVGETTRLATALFSRHCQKRLVYPSAVLRPDAFMDWLRLRAAGGRYRMILPMEDETTMLFAQHRGELERHVYLPVTEPDKIDAARRKDRMLKLAGALGIPVPKTWVIDDLAQLDRLKKELPYPVVIKPRMGSGAVGVRYPAGPQDLEAAYKSVHAIFPYPLIQERIPPEGAGYGASFLFDENGQVKASFVHKRLREYPVTGGASTLRVGVKNDAILEMGRALLEKLDWFGVAMVEFKMDSRDGIPKLMEVNPRFWGSLALAIQSGVNFPYLLYRMARGERFDPVERYTLGKRCRWLLPGDLLHFLHNPDRSRMNPGFFRFFEPNTHYDILSIKDPLPVLARILTPATFFYDPDMKRRLKSRKQ